VGQLEGQPVRVFLDHGEPETMIATLMEGVYQPSLTGAGDDRKMRLVALEMRARLVLERFRKGNAN
jgi:hypothetical protein